MKFTAKATNVAKLEFNDLGKVTKGVSPQERFVALKPGDSIYLPEGENVLYSAQYGDAAKYAKAGYLTIDDTVLALANLGTVVLNHNFGFLPNVTVAKIVGGNYEAAVIGTDVSVTTNATLTTTTVENISGGALDISVRVG
jgi:hypothetical protein